MCNCNKHNTYNRIKRLALMHQKQDKRAVYIYFYLTSGQFDYTFDKNSIPDKAILKDVIDP